LSGGYVKSAVDLDFTKVEIHLYSKEGILRQQTECAPNNGYFMVPFVDIGEYQLRVSPPSGWLFEPMFADIDVNGVEDEGTKEIDINFQFKGFTLSGSVANAYGSFSGPDGVTVKIVSTESKSVIGTAYSKNGGFSLQGIPPGSYEVVASHSSFTFKQHITHASVVSDNAECDGPIIVSGYDLSVTVSSQKQQPVSSVYLLLFAAQQVEEKVHGCLPDHPTDLIDTNSEGYQFVCVTLTNI
jgi:hypothetical protein